MENPGQTTSLWMETAALPKEKPLDRDRRVQVCVIGAGIAGLTTAYLLAREGRSVVVLDDGPVAGGQTQRTTAHLSNAIDGGYAWIERLHGTRGARLVAESHTTAVHRIETILREEGIDCDFERLDGYLFVPPGGSQTVLDREMEAVRRSGLNEVERAARAPLGTFDSGPCLRFPGQAQFHPLKYVAGLTRAIQRDGGEIYTDTHATGVVSGNPARIPTAAGPAVTADFVVVATNTPVNDRVAIHTKQASYMTYVIGARIPHGSVVKALYWDTADPFHYVRLHTPPSAHAGGHGGGAADDLLIVGGEDHKTGQDGHARDRFERLERWARERFPMIPGIQYRWSGQVRESIDGLAYIGRNPLDRANVFVATGDSGMGMTHGTIAGILLTDLILGRRNPWASLYAPARKRSGALARFLKENLNVARQYLEWLKRGDARGQARSRVCPHLGCIVHWNDSEHTWDCPCHGSRFDELGRVICGPANRDLHPAGERTPLPQPGKAHSRWRRRVPAGAHTPSGHAR